MLKVLYLLNFAGKAGTERYVDTLVKYLSTDALVQPIFAYNEGGLLVERLEAMGSVSPATYLDAKYKQTTTFPDVISIQVTLTQFTGVRLRLHYVMTKEGGPVVFEGNSEHCFQDQQGHILRLRKAFPAFAQALDQQLAAGQEA